MTGLVYTAIFGGRDKLQSLTHKEDGVDYVAYVDQHHSGEWGWEQKVKPDTEMKKTPRLRARFYKTLMPKMQQGVYDWCLWLDGSHINRFPVKSWAEKHMLDGYDAALHVHPARKCAYAEAHECARVNKDKKKNVDLAVKKLRDMGYPEGAGLHATGVLFRRINDKTIAHAKDWWDFVSSYSIRDQISFDALAWKHGLKVNTIDDPIYKSDMFAYAGGH